MTSHSLLIIGLGNPLMGDDGMGPAIIDRLQGLSLPDEVGLLDAGVPGLALLDIWQEEDKVWLIDAVDMGLEPGCFRWLSAADLGGLEDERVTAHGGIGGAIKLAIELQQLPEHFQLLAIQPESVTRRIGLSPVAEHGVDLACAEIRRCLQQEI